MNPYVLALNGALAPVADKQPLDRGYYGSFDYYRDALSGDGPPPVSEGGPTDSQLLINEGYTQDNGFLSNGSGIHSTVAAMYGLTPGRQTGQNPAMNPDYEAGMLGDAVGGIGNTDGYGNDILWSTPSAENGTMGQLGEGGIFNTPAGSYEVRVDPWGGYYLHPLGDAIRTASPQLTNLTQGEHHLGINPQTGEVWYQQAAGYTNFSGGGDSYYQNPNAPVAPNSPANSGGTTGGTTGGSPSGATGSNSAGGNPSPIGSSWIDVLTRQGRDLESWDGFLGTFTGLPENPDWLSMDSNQVQSTFNNIWDQGLFSGLSQNQVYADLLKRLGLV